MFWNSLPPKKDFVPPRSGFPLFWERLSTEIGELIKLNAIFLLFSIPVVTLPAAITGMSRVTYLMMEAEHRFTFDECKKTIKETFWSGLAIGLLMTAMLTAGSAVAYFYFYTAVHKTILVIPGIISLFVVSVALMMSFYAFPMLGMTNLNVKAVLANSFRLVFLCPQKSIGALVITAGIICLVWCFFPFTILTIIVIFSFLNFVSAFFVHEPIKHYVLGMTN